MPEFRASQEARDDIVQRNGWALTFLACAFGAAIIACHIESGPRRWGAPAWQFALQVPGSPASWGVVILIAGLFMLHGKVQSCRWSFHVGTLIAFLWFCSLDAASILAFISDENVNPLSPLAWGYISFIYGLRFKLSGRKAYE